MRTQPVVFFRLFALALICLFFSLNTQASGGYGGGYGGGNNFPVQQTDPVYEHGKAVFKGRISAYKDIDFCIITTNDELGFAKIKRKTIKHLKKTSYQKVAENLVSCDSTKQLIYQLITREDMAAVIYYLNKRYKLKLKS